MYLEYYGKSELQHWIEKLNEHDMTTAKFFVSINFFTENIEILIFKKFSKVYSWLLQYRADFLQLKNYSDIYD
jgi:hypothetical protein